MARSSLGGSSRRFTLPSSPRSGPSSHGSKGSQRFPLPSSSPLIEPVDLKALKYGRLEDSESDDDDGSSGVGAEASMGREHSSSTQKEQAEMEKWAGARLIQRTFQRHRVVYSKLGPAIFSRKGGGMADHGEIYFAATNESAPFITVNENTSTALLGTFMEKYWRLNRPEVFISVTGGAQDFQLSSRMQRAFNKGLVSAASSTNAWVVTGGTDTGVMKLVANAFEEGFVHHVPLIAVTSYGCVNGREVCEGARGERVTYASTQGASVTGAPLNPFHTHFVFVDSGKVAPEAWGKEISLRSNLEATYTQLKGVPLVLLVVQGGPGTLQTVLSMAHLQQAILVVRDSGGAADAIADYVLNGKTDDPKFQSEKLQATLATIKELQASSADALLTFFTLQDDEEMSTMLLKALNKTLKPTTNSLLRGSLAVRREMSRNSEAVALAEVRARALTLAVKWNRVDMGQALLHAMSTEMQFTYGHHVALMFMLERGRVELFRLIAACPGFDVSAVNMCKLYFQAEDKYNVLDSPELMGRLYTNVSSISSMTLDKRTGKPTETHELYKHLVCPFIVSLVPELEPIFENSDKVRAHDLFLWAILIGHDELIFEFWKHTEMPVRVALLGAALARSMTERMQFGRKECLDRARRLEEWAIGLMDTVRPQANGAQILSARVPEWGPKMLIDTAMQLEMKEFVSHRTCQALMDVWWRGGYPGGTVQLRDADSLVRVWFYVVCPPLNPYVKQKRPRHKSLISVGAREFTHITDAVLHTYRLSKRETVNAGGTVPELVMGKPRPERLEHILSAAQEVASEEQALKYAKSAEIGAAASRLPSSQGTLVGFYSIPAVKLVVRFSFHILLLLNYAIVLVRLKTIDEVRHTGVPSPTLWEGIFWVQAIAYYLDELYQSIKLKRAKVRPMVNFGWLMSSGDKLLMLAFFCRAASLLKRAPECAGVYECSGAFMARVLYSFFQVTLSLVVIVLSLRIISFRTVDEQLGVLVIMVEVHTPRTSPTPDAPHGGCTLSSCLNSPSRGAAHVQRPRALSGARRPRDHRFHALNCGAHLRVLMDVG